MNTACESLATLTRQLQLACVLEATARKPGNVHRYRDFADVTYLDFVVSAAAAAPVLAQARLVGVGPTVLQAIQQTRMVTQTNTNLGIALLLAPLAAVPAGARLQEGIPNVLDRLTLADAKAVYEAIRLAQPGGLGRVERQDVSQEPTATLREVMQLAANRDAVARQYANCFDEVFSIGVPALLDEGNRGGTVEEAIIACHLRLMAEVPDTLIARKLGTREAMESARRAQHVLAIGGLKTEPGLIALRELDAWLRADGHSRNPGTTADLVTACLFVALREGTMKWPSDGPFSSGALESGA